ncbi:hypothetical protein evm_000726 [Chilo suppressalis]|nr:hypothetical protein evm_000726 [Chilo suppressalis]
MNTQNCINCGISSARSNAIGMHLLVDEAILLLIQQWIAPLTIGSRMAYLHPPATLQTGKWQLSTLEAKKTRAVTICRWVVEVVHSRFKRDYKLFRQGFFNTASKHLMRDLEVAASLINAFHPPITNHADAEVILMI